MDIAEAVTFCETYVKLMNFGQTLSKANLAKILIITELFKL